MKEKKNMRIVVEKDVVSMRIKWRTKKMIGTKILISVLVLTWIWLIYELLTSPKYPDEWEN